MEKVGVRDLRKHLENLSRKSLENEIVELFKKNSFVKDHYQLKLKPKSETEIFEKYLKIIKNEFFPERGDGKLRFRVANKAVSEYKKLSKNPSKIAELLLAYVENGVDFTDCYGDIGENFYYTIEKKFDESLEHIFNNNLQDIYKERCEKIVNGAIDGYGFQDTMREMFMDYYAE